MATASAEPGVDHAEALKAVLDQLGHTVYLGPDDIPDDPEIPYFVVWPAPARRTDWRVRGVSRHASTRLQVTCVASKSTDAVGMADRVVGIANGTRPVIPGRRCGDFESDPDFPSVPRKDPEARTADGRPLWLAFVFFELHSTERTTV